jgi:hypothetical protein
MASKKSTSWTLTNIEIERHLGLEHVVFQRAAPRNPEPDPVAGRA